MKPGAAAAFAALTALAAPALADSPERRGGVLVERDVVDVAPPDGVAIEEVAIDNRLGDVRIEGTDRESVTVLAKKRAADGATLDRLKVSLVPDPSGPLRIATSLLLGQEARPIPAGSVRIDLVVRAQRGARAVIHVWNGHLEVQGMEGGAELVANEGGIEVADASGTITARSARGPQEYRRIFGALEAQGITGDMALELVRGRRLEATLHEGTIVGRDVRVQELSIVTTDADVTLRGRALPGGTFHIASYRGDIDLRLDTGAALALRARSRRGRIRIPDTVRGVRVSDGRYIGVVERAGAVASVELTSRVGNIRFAVMSP